MKYLLFYGFIIFIGGCSFLSQEEEEPPAPLVAIKPLLTPIVLWTAHLGDEMREAQLVPVIQADTIFTATPTGIIQALALRNGQRIWQREIEMMISGGLGTAENLLLLANQQGEVLALSQQDGSEQWRTPLSSEILAVPQYHANIIIIRTAEGKLVALNKQEGHFLWSTSQSMPLLTLRGTSNPLLIQDKVIAGFDNGKLIAFALQTGKLIWEVPIATPHGRTELERMVDIDADLQIKAKTIYGTSFQGRTMAVALHTGTPLWEKAIASYIGMAVDTNALYISDTNSHLWALDRATGTSLWKQEKLQARQITAPVISEDYVVVGDKQGYLHWLHRKDGRFVARYAMGNDSILISPLHVGDILIVYDSAGKMVALRTKS